MNEPVLILANGDPPAGDLLRAWRAHCRRLICCDGAVRVAMTAGISPDLILGDFDSLPPVLPDDARLLPLTEQDTTDLEKAFYTTLAEGAESVVVLGAGGRRWDQFQANLSVFARYADRLAIQAGDAHGWLWMVPPDATWTVPATLETIVSLLPLPVAGGICTAGLRWPLNHERLAVGERDGTSNQIVAEPATVRYDSGCLAVYRAHEPAWP